MKNLYKCSVTFLLLISIIISQTACYDRETAVALTDAGIKTSDLLAEFYSSMSTNLQTTFEISEFNAVIERYEFFNTPDPIADSQEQENEDFTKNSDYKKIIIQKRAEIATYFKNPSPQCDLIRELSVGERIIDFTNLPPDTPAAYKSSLLLEIKELNTKEQNIAVQICTIKAFKERESLAKDLSKYFSSFKQLADYDLSGKIGTATDKLVDSISTLAPFPGVKAVAASGVIGQISRDIADAKQKNDVNKEAKIALLLLQAVKKVFDDERSAYKAINDEFVKASLYSIGFMIKKDKINLWQLLESVPESLGLNVNKTKWEEIPAQQNELPSDSADVIQNKRRLQKEREILLEGFINLIKTRHNNIIAQLGNAEESISKTLIEMENSLTDYINKSKNISVKNISVWIERSNYYLSKYKSLKEELNLIKKQEKENKNATTSSTDNN